MRIKVNTKEKIFIEKFVKFYSKLAHLELSSQKDKEKIKQTYKKICVLLPKYSLLFGDVNLLYKIFNKINGKQIIGGNFYAFLQWTFDELYKNNIITKKELFQLNVWLSKFNLESSKLGVGAFWGGV